MKWTKSSAAKAASRYEREMDDTQREINERSSKPDWFAFAYSEEGRALFNRRERAMHMWVNARKRCMKRSELVKLHRYC